MSSTIFFLLFIPILSFILLIVNFILAPHKPYKEKKTPFECGYHSFLWQNRTPFVISFFVFAILFLIFDLEIVLIYPFTVSSYANNVYGLSVMIIFTLIVTVGFVYELGKNALKIESKQDKSATNNSEKHIIQNTAPVGWLLLFSHLDPNLVHSLEILMNDPETLCKAVNTVVDNIDNTVNGFNYYIPKFSFNLSGCLSNAFSHVDPSIVKPIVKQTIVRDISWIKVITTSNFDYFDKLPRVTNITLLEINKLLNSYINYLPFMLGPLLLPFFYNLIKCTFNPFDYLCILLTEFYFHILVALKKVVRLGIVNCNWFKEVTILKPVFKTTTLVDHVRMFNPQWMLRVYVERLERFIEQLFYLDEDNNISFTDYAKNILTKILRLKLAINAYRRSRLIKILNERKADLEEWLEQMHQLRTYFGEISAASKVQSRLAKRYIRKLRKEIKFMNDLMEHLADDLYVDSSVILKIEQKIQRFDDNELPEIDRFYMNWTESVDGDNGGSSIDPRDTVQHLYSTGQLGPDPEDDAMEEILDENSGDDE